jgi:hypothetical protein
MNKWVFPRYAGITILLLISYLNGWGSVSLPQPTYGPDDPYCVAADSIPIKKQVEAGKAPQDQPVPDVVQPVIKEVPKARKQIKPIAVPPAVVPVKPPVIIKPKIVIKKIGVHLP